MRKKRTIGIAVAVTLVTLLAGWHVGARWSVLRKVYNLPEARHRIAMVPVELDLATLQVTQGVTCNVGYASFVIPETPTVNLMSSGGIAVLGDSESMTFAFLAPWNPKADADTAELRRKLTELPKAHPMRQALARGTHLDMMIQMETLTPVSFSRGLFMSPEEFKLHVTQLVLKSVMPHGFSGVYTFATPTARGLICVGKEDGDRRYAHVSIENRAGTQAVGMITRLPDGKDGDIMKLLPSVLKTFRFTVEGVDSPDRIKQLILEAGIPAKQQHQEME